MRKRHLETISIGGLGSLLGAALFAILGNTLTQTIGRQLSFLELIAGFAVFILLSLIAALWLWRHWHSMRCRVLALSQRRVAHLALGIVLGELIGEITYYALVAFWIPPAAATALLPAPVGLVAWLVCACVIALVWGWRDRPSVTAAQCYYVLRIVERERAAGGARFPFLDGSPAFEIRRQCRILDFLARQPVASPGRTPAVVSRFWSYRINASDPSPADQPAPAALASTTDTTPPEPRPDSLSGAAAPDDSVTGSGTAAALALREREQKEYTGAVQRLITSANALCQRGASKGRWRQGGAELQSLPNQLYARPFFGSKLDNLFNGGDGYRVGGLDGPRFITMVIKGQPGAGKSTAALQLCTTLARHGNICVYYSLEEEREGLFETAADFGWQPEDNHFFPAGTEADYRGVLVQKVLYNRLNMVMRQGVKPRIDDLLQSVGSPHEPPAERDAKSARRAQRANHALRDGGAGVAGAVHKKPTPSVGAVLVSSLGNRAMAVTERMKQLQREWEELPDVLPRCVVIDSLEGFANVGLRGSGEDEDATASNPGVLRSDFLKIKDFFRNRCDMLVVVVEDDGSGKPGYVDFVADTVLQLGRRSDGGYVILSAEVRKARNQMHALGQHQVKIRSLRDIKRASIATSAMGDDPQTTEHGLLIYQSLDYVLSQSRGQSVYDERTLSTGFKGLDDLLGADRAGGMKRQSSAALLGPGTTGKSLIAMNFLIEGVRENRPALLLSLRDDIGIITNKPHPQERERMRFAWHKGPDGKMFHQLVWPVSSIADWLTTRRGQSATDPVELPYLLQDQQGWQAAATQAALVAYLEQVIASAPHGGAGWSEEAQRAVDQAWDGFAQQVDANLLRVMDARQPRALVGQRPVPDFVGGLPVLRWASPPITHRNDLLVVKSWRPGRIAPEDFLNWLLGVIGGPKEPTRFGRVVFDDVSQLNQRFPLLAESRLFLPALVDLFKAKHIASLFLAGYDDATGMPSNSGLDVLADNVIRTSIYRPGDQAAAHVGVSPAAAPHALADDGDTLSGNREDARRRIILVDVDTRPGSRRQAPHELVIDGEFEFAAIRPVEGFALP